MVGAGERLPFALGFSPEHLDRAFDRSLELPGRALDAVELVVEEEVELDGERGGFAVDEFAVVLAAAAMAAKERERDRVEDAGLAAPVGTGEHPQLGAFEEDFLFVLVGEEAGEFYALRDHRDTQFRLTQRHSAAEPP